MTDSDFSIRDGLSIRDLIARLAQLEDVVSRTAACIVDEFGRTQVNPVIRSLALEELQITRELATRRRELRGFGMIASPQARGAVIATG